MYIWFMDILNNWSSWIKIFCVNSLLLCSKIILFLLRFYNQATTFNPFVYGENPKWVLLLTVKTQMKCSIMLHFIRVYTVKVKKIFWQKNAIFYLIITWHPLISQVYCLKPEGEGSVVEYLTRDRGAAGLSLTGVTVLCPWARASILA